MGWWGGGDHALPNLHYQSGEIHLVGDFIFLQNSKYLLAQTFPLDLIIDLIYSLNMSRIEPINVSNFCLSFFF